MRRCTVQGAMATVAYHGDDDAGAIFIRVVRADRLVQVLAPAPAGRDDASYVRKFVFLFDGAFVEEQDADAHIAGERRFDSDIWVIDVEDTVGRHFLDDDLAH